MKSSELSLYRGLLRDIKARVQRAQSRAALSANAELILLYWDIGGMILARQKEEGWGSGVIPRLSTDLKNELPEEKGFSERNLGHMIRFAREYGPPPILQQPAANLAVRHEGISKISNNHKELNSQQLAADLDHPAATIPIELAVGLPWFHHVILIQKIKDVPTRFWYAQQAMAQGWSRSTLNSQIKNRAHERQGGTITNFEQTLPTAHAEIAGQLLKDPYIFDFLTMEEPYRERELEVGLLTHIQKFLLELGRGFAFVGRQYRLAVSDKEFYLDLLFYHLHLRCFVAIDLKKGDFKPEYAGKMNFYCSVVDDQLRHEQDGATIGLILCQTKDHVLAEYTLRDIHKPIGVADYELTRALPESLASSLPSIEDIEAELTETLREDAAQPEDA